MVKLYTYFILAPKFPDSSFSWKFKTSSPLTPYYSLSLYILRIYALRFTPRLPPGSQFTWFAASAERKCEITTPGMAGDAVSWRISWNMEFHNFLNIFQYFLIFFNIFQYSDIFFRFWIEFPARGWSRTPRMWKILKNRFSCIMNTPCEKYDTSNSDQGLWFPTI